MADEKFFEIKLGGWVGRWTIDEFDMISVWCEGAMLSEPVDDRRPQGLARDLMSRIVADPRFTLGAPGGDEDPDFATSYPFISVVALEKYHLALGKFLQKCAQTEVTLNIIIQQFVESHLRTRATQVWHVLKAIMPGQTFGPAAETIRRLMRVTKAAAKTVSEVNEQLLHLQKIVEFRNQIVHNGASPINTNKQGWYRIDNGVREAEADKFVLMFFKRQVLDNMAADLWTICNDLPAALGRTEVQILGSPRPAWRFSEDQLVKRGPKFNQLEAESAAKAKGSSKRNRKILIARAALISVLRARILELRRET